MQHLFKNISLTKFTNNAGNRRGDLATDWSPIRYIIIRVINNIGRPREARVQFVNQALLPIDYRYYTFQGFNLILSCLCYDACIEVSFRFI